MIGRFWRKSGSQAFRGRMTAVDPKATLAGEAQSSTLATGKRPEMLSDRRLNASIM